ncbi:MAG: alpha/beta hydrolase [Pirellulaceae bacterium]
MQKIILLPGMNRDHRIFDRILPLLPTAAVVDWIPPKKHEPIEAYTTRFSRTLMNDEPIVVCGVSFGGIIARELTWRINAISCVLISSVRSPCELPPWIRAGRVAPPRCAEILLNAAGTVASRWPQRIASPATFRARKLAGKSGEWYRWAVAAVLGWKPSKHVERVPSFHIHGNRDSTFPIRYVNPDTTIGGGGHVLTLTHCGEVATILKRIALPQQV